ncbi:MAG: hypothetical protein E5W03_19395, partial [Mesorhizobium sp.]
PVNGEKGLGVTAFADPRASQPLLSARLRGEMPGRAMRGCADLREYSRPCLSGARLALVRRFLSGPA